MNLVCINCPKGCHLNVELEDNEVIVSGNGCPRGIEYAKNEMLDPKRTLTTTVDIESDHAFRLPVISSTALPKDRVMDAIKALKDVKVKAPVKYGDIVVKDILGLGVDIISSKSIDS